ncbi:MAG TPA: hypothetical protein PLO20_15625, partial [Thermogutta sp.]|nr:hypothetical protein [Thermogutta sp.]
VSSQALRPASVTAQADFVEVPLCWVSRLSNGTRSSRDMRQRFSTRIITYLTYHGITNARTTSVSRRCKLCERT